MRYFIALPSIRRSLFTAILAAAIAPACADITFDFETPGQLQSARVGGDLVSFATTTEHGHNSSATSLKFVDLGPEPYENFTYDIPFDTFTSGIISLYIYDTRGSYNLGHVSPKSGGSIIVEDKNNPQDFVAFEVLTYPYGGGGLIPAYYGTEGTVDRLKPNDRFDISSLPTRTIGFHKVEFHVSATDTRLFVDGRQATEVAGPGSTSQLRLRFMADSPSNGGTLSGQPETWVTTPRDYSVYAGEWLYFDDLRIARELPSVSVHTNGFEIISGTPEYDRAGEPGQPGTAGVPPHDNIYMSNFVNQWDVTTSATAVRTGAQAAWFSNETPNLRSITFDLTGAQANTTATVYFYDALGQDVGGDKDNSIIIENANDPAEFLAVEVNNWQYPYFAPIKNYYLTEGTGSFWSGTFPGRTIGWHKVEIGFYPTHTLIALDGFVGHRNNPANIAHGPGLDKPLRLRLMADGATQGGFGNWTTVNELTALYHMSTAPYVYYDNIMLPVPPAAAVSEWQLY